jgi:hypothetical protein
MKYWPAKVRNWLWSLFRKQVPLSKKEVVPGNDVVTWMPKDYLPHYGVNPGYYCLFQCMKCGCKQGCNNVRDCYNCGAHHWVVRQVANENREWLPELEVFMEDGKVKTKVNGVVK